ncbi:MAG: dTDP-6-deoxy-L-hexose 3-O-methyltransferase [Candidatus Lindowbacteria bacterium RIFCSPLOWO2_12_FULL_62_27]|nr:MAG: dTDP-6-deoxy-L-hexose 3-O-methyltransferase [Candidatus Lindowbacteria bacterium RIFCSPLOWO2_02_FULL_62_12]OGH62717.1 MAG: dTDP-6-deoxy-L-hexose 3-O-methyltransferase [Candidatus Lindowbacteria bacterium RIFCSPLOWO2_12_FULL_62_27]
MMFEESQCPTDRKLWNFSKYVRRQSIARFLVFYEIFKRIIDVKGSIVECGIHHGGGLMTWAKLSSTLEPYNYHRKIIGFDTFDGFPSVNPVDGSRPEARVGMFRESYDIYVELTGCIKEYDANRFLNDIPKIDLVKGDANETIPRYVDENKHLLVALLYLDFDIYQPTVTALKTFLPRMPKGAVIAFDEVDNPHWPGETAALLDCMDLSTHRLECAPFEPNVSWIVL